jgi:hypothetical protein
MRSREQWTWWALRGIDPMKWAEKTYVRWSTEHGWHSMDEQDGPASVDTSGSNS